MDIIRSHHPLVGIACLLVLSLSCSPCGWLSRPDSDWPSRPLQITEEASQSLEDKLEGSWDSQGDGDFLLQVTDQELTSYLNLRLLGSADLPLKEPRIWFTRGKIYASGRLSVKPLPFDAQARIISDMDIVDGALQLSIERASYGQIPIPNSIVQSLETRANGILARVQIGIEVLELDISESEILIIAAAD